MNSAEICQSCGMPLTQEKFRGTNADQSSSEDYCSFCYQDGAFLDEGISLEEKIEKNVSIAIKNGMSVDAARNMAIRTIPVLKRWNMDQEKRT